MFGMSMGELLIIFVVAFLVFGPERLPHIATKVGKMAADLRKTSDSFKREIYNAVYTPADEIKTIERDLSKLVSSTSSATQINEQIKDAALTQLKEELAPHEPTDPDKSKQ